MLCSTTPWDVTGFADQELGGCPMTSTSVNQVWCKVGVLWTRDRIRTRWESFAFRQDGVSQK